MLLQLDNINKNYIQGKMDVPVLHDISLNIEEGEYVAIMGPSGSGKSTLMNIIGCLDKPTSGSYILDGVEVAGMKDKELSKVRNKSIGFVFQNFNLLPRQSALQNVELPLQYAKVPRRERKPKCIEALTSVDLQDRMSFKPTQLSGGQKQRVAIARAMVNSPKILLADEPTGALDSKSGIQVMGLFEKLHNDGVTIIMITHAREIAEYADRIITIFDGRVTSDVINNNKIVAAYDSEAGDASTAVINNGNAAAINDSTLADSAMSDGMTADSTMSEKLQGIQTEDQLMTNDTDDSMVEKLYDIITDDSIEVPGKADNDSMVEQLYDIMSGDSIEAKDEMYGNTENLSEDIQNDDHAFDSEINGGEK